MYNCTFHFRRSFASQVNSRKDMSDFLKRRKPNNTLIKPTPKFNLEEYGHRNVRLKYPYFKMRTKSPQYTQVNCFNSPKAYDFDIKKTLTSDIRIQYSPEFVTDAWELQNEICRNFPYVSVSNTCRQDSIFYGIKIVSNDDENVKF